MAVYAAVRDEPDDVHRVPAVGATVYRCYQCRVSEEVTLADAPIDPGKVLEYDPTGAQVHMPDFRVAHLARGKPHSFARSDEGPVRILLQELVKRRRSSKGDRVVVAILAKAPSVKNDQDQGWLGT